MTEHPRLSVPLTTEERVNLNASVLSFGSNLNDEQGPACPMPSVFVSRVIAFISDNLKANGHSVDITLMQQLSKYKNAGATRQVQIMLDAYKGRENTMAQDIYSKFYELDENYEFTCLFANETDGVRKILIDDLRQCQIKARELLSKKPLSKAECKQLPKAISRPGLSSALFTLNFNRHASDIEPMIDFSILQTAILKAKKFCSSRCSSIESRDEFRDCIEKSVCNVPSDIPLEFSELGQLALMYMLLLLDKLIKEYFAAIMPQMGGSEAEKGFFLILFSILTVSGIVCSVFTAGACSPMPIVFGILLLIAAKAGGGIEAVDDKIVIEQIEKYIGKTKIQRVIFEKSLIEARIELEKMQDIESIDITAYFLKYLSERIKLDYNEVKELYNYMQDGKTMKVTAKVLWKGIRGVFCSKPLPFNYEDIVNIINNIPGNGKYTLSRLVFINKIDSLVPKNGGSGGLKGKQMNTHNKKSNLGLRPKAGGLKK